MSIEEDVKRCKELIKIEHASWIGLSNQKAITGVLARIKELEEENKIYVLNGDNVNLEIHIKSNYIPKQKVKDVLTEIQEEYNKVQEQFDCIWNKKSKDNYDRYKLQELSAMQQELGFILGKLEKILEDK